MAPLHMPGKSIHEPVPSRFLPGWAVLGEYLQ